MTISDATHAATADRTAADRATEQTAARDCARLDQCRRSTPCRDRAPLSNDAWAVLAPTVDHHHGPGRPIRDARRRFDAIHWPATRPQRRLAPWPTLDACFGKPDTLARQFRRHAHDGLRTCLLETLADPKRPGIAILRRLRLPSVLQAPSVFRPDRHLSEYVKGRLSSSRHTRCAHGSRAAAPMPGLDFVRAVGNLLETLADPKRPGIAILRRLRLPSVLQAPSVFRPDRHLSEYRKGRPRPSRQARCAHGSLAAAPMPGLDFVRIAGKPLRAGAGGRIDRRMAPW